MSITLIKSPTAFGTVKSYDELKIIAESTQYAEADCYYRFKTYVKSSGGTYSLLSTNKYYPVSDTSDTLLNTRAEFNVSAILESQFQYIPNPQISGVIVNQHQLKDYKVEISDIWNYSGNQTTTILSATCLNNVGTFERDTTPRIEYGYQRTFLTDDTELTLSDNQYNTLSFILDDSIVTDKQIFARYKVDGKIETYTITSVTEYVEDVTHQYFQFNITGATIDEFTNGSTFIATCLPSVNGVGGTYTIQAINENAGVIELITTTPFSPSKTFSSGTLKTNYAYRNFYLNLTQASLTNKHLSIPASFKNLNTFLSDYSATTEVEITLVKTDYEYTGTTIIDVDGSKTLQVLTNTITINRETCNNNRFEEYQLYYVNDFGGWDTFTLSKKTIKQNKVSRLNYQKRLSTNYLNSDRGTTNIKTNVDEQWIMNTALLESDADVNKFIQLYNSPAVYLIMNDKVYAVNVINTDYTQLQAVNNDVLQYSITIEFSNRLKKY